MGNEKLQVVDDNYQFLLLQCSGNSISLKIMENNVDPPSCSKRIRNPNYTLDEKSLVLQLVAKYKNIIENKKTDAITNVNKERTWLKIAHEFNAAAPGNVHRDAVSLKKVYMNIKKNVRQEVANEKIEIVKTGGGGVKKINNPLQELALSSMNGKTVFGLQNKFDSDNLPLNNTDHEDDEPFENNEVDEEVELIYITNNEDCEPVSTEDHAEKWKASDLKRPLDPLLQQKRSKIIQGVQQNENIKNRRRPTAAAASLHSSEIGKLYSKLCEEKLEVARIEQKIMENRLNSEKIKQQLEIDILQTELAMKRKKLEGMTE